MTENNPAQRIAQTAQVLWSEGQAGKRGPKPRLSLEKISRAAISVADADGLATVSMQRVASELGYTPMSLYTYVPNKELLLEAMMDTMAGICLPEPAEHPDWRTELHAFVTDMWLMFVDHPWLLQIPVIGAPLGPHQLTWFERLLTIIDKSGLAHTQHAPVGLFLLSAVRGMAKAILDMRGQADSAADAGAADAMTGQVLATVASPQRFPHVTAAYDHPAQTTDWYESRSLPEDLRLGIDRLLDGVEKQAAEDR